MKGLRDVVWCVCVCARETGGGGGLALGLSSFYLVGYKPLSGDSSQEHRAANKGRLSAPGLAPRCGGGLLRLRFPAAHSFCQPLGPLCLCPTYLFSAAEPDSQLSNKLLPIGPCRGVPMPVWCSCLKQSNGTGAQARRLSQWLSSLPPSLTSSLLPPLPSSTLRTGLPSYLLPCCGCSRGSGIWQVRAKS